MNVTHAALLGLLAGCQIAPHEPQPPQPVDAGPAVACLPAVARECSCVYPCSTGERTADPATYAVHVPGYPAPITGTLGSWCVHHQCSTVFLLQLPCGIVCNPRVADATCAFDGGVCSSHPVIVPRAR